MVYRVDRNNFYTNEKKATIYTPDTISKFLFDTISPYVNKRDGVIFDPCVGSGSLLRPWQNDSYDVLGIDIEYQGFKNTKVQNYLQMTKKDIKENIALVIMNPPFNIDKKTKEYIKQHYGGRPLLPEVWLQKALNLVDKNTPIVMFTPYGFRLNQTEHSTRWLRFYNQEYPEITSIISLPKDAFEGILFHSEVLCFNLPQLKGHYFVDTGKNRARETLFA